MTTKSKDHPNDTRGSAYGQPHGLTYAADMVKRVLFGIQAFRTDLRDRIEAAEQHGEHTVVAKRGKPVGAYVPIDWYREATKAMRDPTEF